MSYKNTEKNHGRKLTDRSAQCKKDKHGRCVMMNCECTCHVSQEEPLPESWRRV